MFRDKERMRVHDIWKDIKKRCTNPKHWAYKWYGGKGVTLCERWMTFQNFVDDWPNLPKGMTIDRIDNSKGYSPDNCRLATRMEQALNRSGIRFFERHGRRLCITHWEVELGFSHGVIRQRLMNGWSIEDAFTRPQQRRKLP